MNSIKAKEQLENWNIVMGYPLTLEGHESPMCQNILQFLHNVHKKMPLNVIILWDERFSTVSSQWELKEWQFTKASERKRIVDRKAAALILQDFLDGLSYCREKQIEK